MGHIYILEADPTRMGGIQKFVRNLSNWLPESDVTLLAYYSDLAKDMKLNRKLHVLCNRRERNCFQKLFGSLNGIYISKSAFVKNMALLADLWQIRRQMVKIIPDNSTLVLNSASAMLMFCPLKLLRNNRIILVQHSNPETMYKRRFDFGGVFRNLKIWMFKKYVTTFIMLSPLEKDFFASYLPLADKDCRVIRHACEFPAELPQTYPQQVAILSRLVPQKRIDRAIACAKLLPDVQFNIYGTGFLETNLKASAIELDNVHFCGYTDNLHMVFNENQLLLITSDYEGYPISGIEACVHCRPIVVLNSYSAAKDLVENEVNGLVLDDFSPKALASAIKKVFNNHEKYRTGALKHRDLYSESVARDKWQQLLINQG